MIAFLVGGVDDVLAVDVGDAAGADGTLEGDLRNGKGSRRSHHGQHFRRVFLIGGEDGQGDLHVVVHSLGEQGSNGAVSEPGGEDTLLPWAAFAAEEAAGYSSGGVEPFFVVHGERQEVDILGPGAIGHHGGGEDYGFAVADGHCSVGLEGEATGLEYEGLAADFAMQYGGGC